MRNIAIALMLGYAVAGGTSRAQDDSPGETIIVLDASGSMWGQIDGKPKIDIAKETIRELLKTLDPGIRLGLMAYGHRREGDCEDIELLIPPGKVNREAFLEVVMAIAPKGKTPLTDAVEQAAAALRHTEAKANVILVSDGIENCNGDLCALAKQLEKEGIDFTAHVVAFDLAAQDARTMDCLARETGGRFLAAQDAASLKDALEMAVRAVVRVAPPKPVEEDLGEATLAVPKEAPAGSVIRVKWDGPDNDGDYITIVPADAKEGEWQNFTYTSRGNPLELTAPITPGPCEVRYLAGRSRKTLGRASILIVPVTATVKGPAEVGAGSEFPVEWTGPGNRGDYITIVAKDAEEGRYGNYRYAQTGSPVQLRAGIQPGDYELRYIAGQKAKILGRADIRVTPAEASLSGPAQAPAGSTVKIEWTGPANQGDYITIVPKDADDRKYGKYSYTKNAKGSAVEVTAPIDPGACEIRYITGQKASVLARADIEITPVTASVKAPAEVVAGAEFEVQWSGPGNQGDYITVVPAGAANNIYKGYAYARGDGTAKLTALESAGDAEVRYVTGAKKKILARQPLKVLPAKVTLEAADEVVAGSPVEVAWSPSINPQDYITIVMKDAKEGKSLDHFYVAKESPQKVDAPETAGEGEIRYVSAKGRKTVARRPIRILEAKVTLNGPAEMVAGEKYRIEWTGPNNARDYIVIVPKGADTRASGRHINTNKGGPQDLVAPKEPGEYELRYMTGKLRKVLAAQAVRVVAE